ncbi:MAG: VWA domain-containing protein [bacterium]
MRFEHPLVLFALALVPLLYRFGYRESSKRYAALAYSDLAPLRGRFKLRGDYRKYLFALRVTALVVIVVALARPQLERGFETVTSEGIDIMLGLDISGSMRAEDFRPDDRITVAKQVVADFVSRNVNDRIGVVAFAGRSFTRCPLTLDHEVLKSLVETIDIGMIEDGTAIGLALANCVARLEGSDAKSKIIILLTDGINNRGEIDPLTGASLAKAAGIRVYTVGVGKQGGAPVPVFTPDGRKVYARNPDGSPYLAEPDEPTLKQIAALTDGTYYRATDETALDEIYRRILEMERSAFEVKYFKVRKEVVKYVLPVGILALLVEALLASTVWRRIP